LAEKLVGAAWDSIIQPGDGLAALAEAANAKEQKSPAKTTAGPFLFFALPDTPALPVLEKLTTANSDRVIGLASGW